LRRQGVEMIDEMNRVAMIAVWNKLLPEARQVIVRDFVGLSNGFAEV
jgi:hypothetical protein